MELVVVENIQGFITLNIYALLLIFFISIVFHSKSRLHHIEDNTYSCLLVVTILVTISGIILGFLVNPFINQNEMATIIANKIYLISLVTWIIVLTFYTYYVSIIKTGECKKVVKVFKMILIFNIFVILFLPITVVFNQGVAIAYGLAVAYTYIVIAVGFIVQFILLFIDKNNFKNKKYIPVYMLVVFGTLDLIIQMLFPGLNYLINPSLVLIVIFMYFTIENPDIKMLEELYKNKKIIEKNNENTSNFLFKISQSVKNPVRQIIDKTSNKEELIEINNLGKELEYVIDYVLDVTKMTTKSLKLYTSRYNPKNLFNEIKYRTENNLDKNIKLEYKVSPNIPKYVYGDSIKLKQILSSILENSINHTEKGFIEIEINTIIKYGICRFIIDITDSGKGISIDKVNDILSLEESLEKIDDEKITLNLKEVKAITEKLGGFFMIKSDEDSGTTVSITIDQKVVETKDEELTKRLEAYEESLYSNKKIMVIDDDAKELSEIVNFFEKNNVIVHGSLFGKDIIEKISNKHKYDLIILDDETNTGSALSTLQELKKNDKFNIPVVVMLDDNKEFIKLHYLKDGFADTISKSKLKDELERILKRF